MRFDIVVIGAGPAGLSLARSLAGHGLSIAVIERQPEDAIANPAFDGREIALSRRSVAILQGLDAWRRIPAEDVSALRTARVLNGGSRRALCFDPGRGGDTPLAHLVANHLIRRAVYEAAVEQPDVTILYGTAVTSVAVRERDADVVLADGRTLTARLVVAADTRFSEIRRRMGIPAAMHDFGKVMIVSRVTHDRDHHHVATEWFEHGHTIAMLPLNGLRSSAVLTDTAAAAERLMAMDAEAFGAEVTRRFRGRYGPMHLDSKRTAFPLVSVYAEHFVKPRFALVGDAAVGMHPVTAHGFNFGLSGQDVLSRLVLEAHARGGDIGAMSTLRPYETKHRMATRPMFLATNAVARLYTDERLPARVAREAAIRLGQGLPMVRGLIVSRLMRREIAARV
jgi:ubiquinone biosynthesis UbiH/UbiF/VisC/COQ6 family hydroxylase